MSPPMNPPMHLPDKAALAPGQGPAPGIPPCRAYAAGARLTVRLAEPAQIVLTLPRGAAR